MFVCDVKRTFI